MPCIQYISKEFHGKTLVIIEQANDIIQEYQAAGFELTLRQLYYQFVARALLPNSQKSYNRLGSIINDARLAGYIDWDAIEDRTRSLRALSHWETPEEIILSAATSFHTDLWADQPVRVEVWIEKDALAGVIEGVCTRLDVPYFSCRGYTSQSEMHSAAMRLQSYQDEEQDTIILHFGDHDPSGIDMTRDIKDRMDLFIGGVEVRRLALNMAQVLQYNPPPNPTKITDSRANGYIAQFGYQSWELDALDPRALAVLIEDEIVALRDSGLWDAAVVSQEDARQDLTKVSEYWPDIVHILRGYE